MDNSPKPMKPFVIGDCWDDNTESSSGLREVPCPRCGYPMGWDDTEPEPCNVCQKDIRIAALEAANAELKAEVERLRTNRDDLIAAVRVHGGEARVIVDGDCEPGAILLGEPFWIEEIAELKAREERLWAVITVMYEDEEDWAAGTDYTTDRAVRARDLDALERALEGE